MTEVNGEPVAARASRSWHARVRAELGLFLQLVGACGLVFARPVLDSFGRSPETFVAAAAGWKAIVFFGVFWVVVPPALLWAVTFAVGWFGPQARRGAHMTVVGALAAAFVAQALVQGGTWSLIVVWILAGVAGAAAILLWRRFAPARDFLTVLAVAPVVFLAMFLVSSPTSDLLGDSAAAGAATGAHLPVVMIVLDELPTASLLDGSGRIDPAVFPGFARLAADGTWYRNHTTVAPTTTSAVPAILTGRFPSGDAVAPVAARFPQNLFTLLGRSYAVHASEPLTALCPSYVCAPTTSDDVSTVLDRAVDLWWDRFHRAQPAAEAGMFDPVAGGEHRGPGFADFIAGIAADPPNRLDFAHVVLPHVPWDLTPSGRHYDAGTDVGLAPFFYSWADADSARFNRERHLTQTQYADHEITTLLGRLDRLGTYDDSLIVVTADHGIAFTGGEPARATAAKTIDQIAWSPLFIKAPGQRAGRIDDRNAQSIDILPTIADLIGARLPWRVDGRSLAGPPRRSSTKHLVPDSLNVLPTDDGRIVIDGRAGLRSVLGFRPGSRGSDEFALFRDPPYGDVVGRRQSDLPFAAPVRGDAQLDHPDLEVEAPPADLPVTVLGTVVTPERVTTALVVNGVVVGTSRPDGDDRVRFLIPESVLRTGRNDLDLVAISGPTGGETLQRFRAG